ncbi:MAG: choice-of-anchor J domain-containing protein, partial [Muribaculaceae bacterium]|nr:choice-of-anchor J domain-containing protein [Muribaculaceae bacterium]
MIIESKDRTRVPEADIIDANGDGGSEWEDPCWKYDPQYYCAFYYGKRDKPADDWLITPALNLDPAIAYRITFKYYAYYGYGSHMRVATGAESTVEGMDNVILDKEFVSSFSDYPGVTESFLFAPREGDRFIGFHHLSQTMEHLSIDDILIEPFTFSGVPAQVTDVVTSATPDRKARLSFNLPVLTLGGGSLEGPLTVTIMRGDETCIDGIISDCQPGQHIEWTDPSSVQAVNVYNITVTNSIGSSMSTEVSVDLSRGIPVSVTNVVARSLNSNQVEITWNPSVSDTDDKGNPVDVASIRYLVYKPVPGDFGTDYILIGRDLDECRFIDDNPSLGYAADDSQKLIFYYVAPVNGDSEGVAAPSNTLMTGKSYNLPFAESWNEQVASTNPWTRVYAYGGTWYTR